MATNPLYADVGAESLSIPIGLILFDGTRLATRGTFSRTPVTSGSASDGLALTGTSAWFALPFAYDPETIQFVVPDVAGSGFATGQRWRVIKAQRSHGGAIYWDTCQGILSDIPGAIAGGGMFSPLDFSPLDFNTGA